MLHSLWANRHACLWWTHHRITIKDKMKDNKLRLFGHVYRRSIDAVLRRTVIIMVDGGPISYVLKTPVSHYLCAEGFFSRWIVSFFMS